MSFLTTKRRCGFLCALAGAMSVFGLPPFTFMLGPFLGFTLFAVIFSLSCMNPALTEGQIWRRSAFLGWCFGFGYFGVGLWWICKALLIDAPHDGWILPFSLLGIPAFLGCFWALAGVIAASLYTRCLPLQQGSILFCLAVGFTLSEWLRGFLFTGFPWNSIGYLAMPCAFCMQSERLIGLDGMNFFALLLFSSPSLFLRPCFRIRCALAMLGLIGIILGFDYWRFSQAPSLAALRHNKNPHYRIRLVQPNIAQRAKMDPKQQIAHFEKLLQLSLSASKEASGLVPDIIIWPETAFPYVINYAPELVNYATAHLKPGQILLTGAIYLQGSWQDAHRKFFNALVALDSQGQLCALSAKKHLVPFGEYMPFATLCRKIGLHSIAEDVGGYSAGSRKEVVSLPNGLRYLPLICYEAIFPHEMTYQGPCPHIILNVTNDAWYGHSPGPYQHFQQARLRAVELGLPLLRVANTGISAVIDSYGRVVQKIALEKTGFIDCQIVDTLVPTKKL